MDPTTPTARIARAIGRLLDAAAELERMVEDIDMRDPMSLREPAERDAEFAEAVADAAAAGVAGLWQRIGNRARRETWGEYAA